MFEVHKFPAADDLPYARRNRVMNSDSTPRLRQEAAVDAPQIDPRTLLTPAEVAAILYVDPKTVTRWAKAGKLESFRTPGGHRRFLKSEILTLITGDDHSHGGAVPPTFSAYALASIPPAPGAAMHQDRRQEIAAGLQKRAAAAAVVAEAVAIALEVQADEAAEAVSSTARAVATAARTAAEAANAAREARAFAASLAAEAVASDAARAALVLQLRADASAAKLSQAAAQAVAIVAAASLPGAERESALTALRLAATVKAAAVATAEDTAAAAAAVAAAVAVAAAGVALKNSAAAVAFESEAAKVAATVQATATATARRVAAETDARASGAALVARETAAAVRALEDAWDTTGTSLEAVTSKANVAAASASLRAAEGSNVGT
jgi:excisionase family DNA binding protein